METGASNPAELPVSEDTADVDEKVLHIQNEISSELETLINKWRGLGVSYADVLGVLEISKGKLLRESLDVAEANYWASPEGKKRQEEEYPGTDTKPTDPNEYTDDDILNPPEPKDDK